jgi:hypothetical protein
VQSQESAIKTEGSKLMLEEQESKILYEIDDKYQYELDDK